MPEMRVPGSVETLRIALKDVPASMMPDGITGGDTKIIWDPENAEEVENARRTFDDLKKKGFAAFAVEKGGGKGEQVFKFDRYAERYTFTAQQRGGA